jgi:hypothetical protein
MAVLYTPEEIQEVLRELRIKPIDGKVTTLEAAKILSWRAKAEQGVIRTYNASAVRRHIQLKNLTPIPESSRFNRYIVEDIFDVPLAPKRGPKQNEREDGKKAA